MCAYCGITRPTDLITLDHVRPRRGQSAYDRPDNLVLLNQPTTTKVTISGLTQDVKNATVRADVDLSKIKKGSAFTLTPTARVFGNNVTPQSAQPITFGVDDLTTVQLDIDIRTPHVQQGWSVKKVQPICGNAAQVCKVTFTGPSSLEDGLHAFVTVDGAIATNSYDQLSSTVQFDQNGRVFDPAAQKALPLVGWNPQTVTAHVEAQQGTSIIRVPLVDAFPSAQPAAGYHLTGVSIDPPLVEITGPPDVLAKITKIVLPAVSLSSYTSDHTFRVSIPIPDPGVSLNVTVCNVTYSIAKNPAVSPSP